ncbi:unnamed protein product, partial [Polarella glacialis]
MPGASSSSAPSPSRRSPLLPSDSFSLGPPSTPPTTAMATARLREAVSELEALRAEAAWLEDRASSLRDRHPEEPHLLRAPIGIALSGGGIRAAAFHCGLLWALASEGLMKDVLQLASVSGGAYTAASLATHLMQAADSADESPSLDKWYQEVVARTILRMQRNINYVVDFGPGQLTCPDKNNPEEAGRGCLPKVFDLPIFVFTILSSVCLSPALIGVNVVWPMVLCIEHALGGALRAAWCDPLVRPGWSQELFDWTMLRLVVGTGGMISAALLLALLKGLGCCRPRPPNYLRHLFRRSLQQVLVRGALCYSLYIPLPWLLVQMQNMTWGGGELSEGGQASWVRYVCWRYVSNQTAGLAPLTCSDTNWFDGDLRHLPWYLQGNNALYLDESWVAANHVNISAGFDPDGSDQYITPLFLTVNGVIAAAGLAGLLFGLSLLRWFLTVAGPLWAAFLVAQVAQWRVFGPLTGQ